MCQCNTGYKGADCSEKVELLTNGYSKTLRYNGTGWTYFQLQNDIPLGNKYVLSLTSNYPLDVFVIAGDNEPTQFKNDLEFRTQKSVKISFASFPQLNTFVASVRVNGLSAGTNTYNQVTLTAKFTVTPVSAVTSENPTTIDRLYLLASANE